MMFVKLSAVALSKKMLRCWMGKCAVGKKPWVQKKSAAVLDELLETQEGTAARLDCG